MRYNFTLDQRHPGAGPFTWSDVLLVPAGRHRVRGEGWEPSWGDTDWSYVWGLFLEWPCQLDTILGKKKCFGVKEVPLI